MPLHCGLEVLTYAVIHETFGTLWAECLKSVIVEGDGETLLAVSAYEQLNDPSFLRLYRIASLNSQITKRPNHKKTDNICLNRRNWWIPCKNYGYCSDYCHL